MQKLKDVLTFLLDVAASFLIGGSVIAVCLLASALVVVSFQYLMTATGFNGQTLASSMGWLFAGMIVGWGMLGIVYIGDDIREYILKKE